MRTSPPPGRTLAQPIERSSVPRPATAVAAGVVAWFLGFALGLAGAQAWTGTVRDAVPTPVFVVDDDGEAGTGEAQEAQGHLGESRAERSG
jgi:hypothetical protein